MTVPTPQGVTGFQPVQSGKPTGKMPVSLCTGKMPVTPLKPFNRGAETQKSRRNLPHWRQAGCTYFVTFRLADSLPQSQLKAWQEERAVWMKVHPEPWTAAVTDEYEERFLERIQTWLDAGYGSCALSKRPIQALVAGALAHFDAQRYRLGDFVLMPNHVHALVTPAEGFTFSSILHSWKSYTANKANELLCRAGTFWMDENFDHIVRSTDQLRHFEQYIGENPVKAGLKTATFLLRQGVTGFQPVGNQGDTGILPVESGKTTGWKPVAPSATGKIPATPSMNRPAVAAGSL